MNHTAIASLLLLFSFAFSFEIARSVDRTSLTLGDPLLFKITATRQQGQKLLFPGPDASFGNFELRDLRSTEEKKGGNIVETYFYTLATFKLGATVIPAMRVVNAADTADAKATAPVDIIINKVGAADTSDIVDIYGQESVGRGFGFYAVIVAVVLLLGLAVYFFDRWLRKKGTSPSAPVVPLSPEEQFEKDMQELESARFLERGEVKEFHLRISEILRRYLGGRLGFEALESTTYELFSAFRAKNMDKAALRFVEEFCEINDPVKFAKWIPDTATSEKLLLLSREIVQRLTPLPAPSSQAAPLTVKTA
ncbi:MAG: hypothetical protein V1913_08895 [Fibrobacterota bacterium]